MYDTAARINDEAMMTKAFTDVRTARRELIKWAIAFEYIYDADMTRMTTAELTYELQRGARLACAYTNQDGFRERMGSDYVDIGPDGRQEELDCVSDWRNAEFRKAIIENLLTDDESEQAVHSESDR